MKDHASSQFSKWLRPAAVVIVAIGMAMGPAVHARPKSKKAATEPANVVAHVELSSGSATRMLLVKKNGKEYLVLGLDSPSHIIVLDVSEPSQPSTIDTAAGIAGASAAELTIV